MNIVHLGLRLLARVSRYRQHVQRFFYEVVLAGYACPQCGDRLVMISEGQCQCQRCQSRFDPTLAFGRCSTCGGKPELQIRRYRCKQCGGVVPSRFLFDGLVFDAAYFREKMAEHRQRKKQQRERVRRMLAECRSLPLDQGPINLGAVAGLTDALNSLTSDAVSAFDLRLHQDFDLQRYHKHLQAHIGTMTVDFEETLMDLAHTMATL